MVDELHGAPTSSNGALGARPPPLTATGEIWRPGATRSLLAVQ